MTVCRWADVHKANKLMNQMGQKDAQLVMSSVMCKGSKVEVVSVRDDSAKLKTLKM